MDPRKELFFDSRLSEGCAYCGGRSSTRDHVPSKVFLDKPYPGQLPVVKACETCNQSFSLDEEYVACMLSCVLSGSAEPDKLDRVKMQRILRAKPALRTLIEQSRSVDSEGRTLWEPDSGRVTNVVQKLATGHATFEDSNYYGRDPHSLDIVALPSLSDTQRDAFETPMSFEIWPEIGSRAFVRTVRAGADVLGHDTWQVVQESRYRYLTSFSQGTTIRLVVSEYLAAEVRWI